MDTVVIGAGPAGFSHLPGMRFPAERHETPTKDAMADYLRSYAEQFRLPIELGTRVDAIRRSGSNWSVLATDGRYWGARNVVVGRIRRGELEASGVQRLPRVVATRNGFPVDANGETVQVDAVVWCTGYRADHHFLHVPAADGGNLIHRRGVTGETGLYVLGMPNQSSITSHLVGGVGKDAAYIAKHLSRRTG